MTWSEIAQIFKSDYSTQSYGRRNVASNACFSNECEKMKKLV